MTGTGRSSGQLRDGNESGTDKTTGLDKFSNGSLGQLLMEVAMSCPYFKKGYFGTCCASISQYVPSIEQMERYCFKEIYGLCPILSAYQDHAYQEV